MDCEYHQLDLGSLDQGNAPRSATEIIFGGIRCRAHFRANSPSSQWDFTILLHGWGGSSRSWERFDSLVGGNLVICPDMRGFGASPEDGLAPAFDQHVRDVAELVVCLANRGRVAIIGHSYGGLIAQQVAARYANCIGALVLLSTQSRCQPFVLTKATRNLVTAIEDAASRKRAIRRLIPRYYRAGSLNRQEMKSLVDDACRATPRALRESLLSAADAAPLDPAESNLFRSPVLTLTGQYDILPANVANQVSDAFPNAHQAIIQGAAHCAAYDQPSALAALVNPFLEQALARKEH